ncbi:MAG: GTP-binding protein [Leptolyngbyaceae bacterium]|nr:GTP-binding protein [Leptolyngbyaceae bacterium]
MSLALGLNPKNVMGDSELTRFSYQESHLNQAKASLREALARHAHRLRSPSDAKQGAFRSRGSTKARRFYGDRAPEINLQTTLKPELEQLEAALTKLDQGVIRIAAFGLVSRGKSALLNALLGQKVFQSGPINGVTQWPRSVRWLLPAQSGKVQVELIDTPGLDEIQGQARAQMAQDVARQADLILFVVAGDMTRTEYQALCDLREAQKPLLLVFNKIDLYPDQDREAIYQHLRSLSAGNSQGDRLQQLLSIDEIVLVAAEPMPLQVRVEWPDGQVTYEWEAPPPQMDALKQKILSLLNQEGRTLLALNALRQAREAETAIAHKTVEFCQTEAETLIWKFAQYKALAIALNPVAFLDLIGGAVTDLVMIRALAKLYGLPMTRYEAGKLWKTILFSSGGLIASELVSGLFFGLGKTTAAVASAVEGSVGVTAYAGAAIAQAGMAGYGAYVIGRAAQVYLEQGCTWGPQGTNTIIENILSQVPPDSILSRLRPDLLEKLADR